MGLVVLVRHGQASFGSDDYDVLSETGWEQGRLLGSWLADRGVTPDLVVRGDLRRHRETCQAIEQSAAGWPDAVVDTGWDEFDHEGVIAVHPEQPEGDLDRRGFQQLFEAATARWAAGADPAYPESYAAFVARVERSLAGAVAEAGSGRTVVVVTSGGPIGVACARLVDPGADQSATARLWSRFNAVTVNSSFTRVVVGSTGPRLLTFNEHPHLEGDVLTYR